VAEECPVGEDEGSCEPPAPLPAWDVTDADDDSVPDAVDDCPRAADPDQLDADDDGRGDACDACPVYNPGLMPCPRSIAELRTPASRLPLKVAVMLTAARVTALRTEGSKGFYLEDGDHAAYSGIFVYTNSTAPGVQRGAVVGLQAYFDAFQGTDELVSAELLSETAGPGDYEPLLVSLADAADGSSRAAGLSSLLIRIESSEVETTNPDAPKDYDETQLLGGLRLDDLIWTELDNQYLPGTRFGAIQGIAGFSFGHQKLYPRAATDLSPE
jgi:hypothetical protein